MAHMMTTALLALVCAFGVVTEAGYYGGYSTQGRVTVIKQLTATVTETKTTAITTTATTTVEKTVTKTPAVSSVTQTQVVTLLKGCSGVGQGSGHSYGYRG
ncbi:uncharacterized protein LOC119598565 [Penaeus monodon]|uniref:uncharacterized protein LOC119598565 n=1 Tax=Penaeus monodon TaxID=6687 RepID=UPI0018A6E681|nr:uncharacterized protein LOC119598565 [Penaeus monodon]